ncbi:hypothetical protein HYH03_001376 [Edaphochlamys debaryana]|uniref:Ricin B lectin domain-containing protein n=1 Tax=Edaphochlamys debaryana TaxID=47281 RepID=A0A835YF42_9CHLO|nr:hypothetical protein HYH03_001376 [Edaphochlamys debaryana]|eukprot:KAG2500609.1 hypothetical protein HYH03_001376 [Edaphochlamys debaryana]
MLAAALRTGAAQSGGAQGTFAKLRSGVVELTPATEKITRRRVPPSRDEPPQLLLVKVDSGKGGAFRDDVLSGGGHVVGYVPDDTLMVWGPPGLIEDAAGKHGASMAELSPRHKVPGDVASLARDASERARARKARAATRDRPSSGDSATAEDDDANAVDPSLAGLETWQSANPGRGTTGRGLLAAGAGSTAGTASPPLYGINVQIVPALSSKGRMAIAKQWPSGLAAALGRTDAANDPCWPKFDDRQLQLPGLPPWRRVYMCAEDLDVGLQWLQAKAETVWVEPVHRAEASNVRAGWTLQTGHLDVDRSNFPLAEHRPYWRAGLMGNREIVQVVDTGVDLDHCYFVDDAYDPVALRDSLNVTAEMPTWLRPDARKVMHYVAGNNITSYGDEGGHGTHVSGSVAGAAGPGHTGFREDEGTGGAPMARISFLDAGIGNSFIVPWPFDTAFYAAHEAVGARISTNSWSNVGRASVQYSYTASEFDRHMWKTPEVLQLQAAANDGGSAEMGCTIPGSSLAKNVVTIGALENYPEGGSEWEDTLLFRYTSNSKQLTSAFTPDVGTDSYTWSGNISTAGGRISVVLASPEDACATLVGNTYAGRAVIVALNTSVAASCDIATKARAAAAAGAKAVLFYRGDDDYAFWNSRFPNLPNKEFPAISGITYTVITQRQAQWLKAGLALAGSDVHIYAPAPPDPLVMKRPGTVAYFSSYGPAWDGRIKPDLMSPGTNILSASKGDGILSRNSATCSSALVHMQGTSMATPLATGHFTLMRQYFREGFYPAGARGPTSANFTPSGMLLKATAIAGATSLQGQVARNAGRMLGAPPDGIQGWGRLSLSDSLPLPGLTADGMALQVADWGTIAEGETITLTGLRSTGGVITAALVWYDYPAESYVDKQLVNNLDLYYSLNGDATKRFTLGDPASPTSEDRTNNVERIQLTLNPGDTITFYVVGRTLGSKLISWDADAALPQRWALAVVGRFSGALRTALNPAFMQPSRLPAFQRQSLVPLSHTIGLAGGTCLSSSGTAAAQSSACTQGPSTVFTITEEGQPFTRIRTGGSASSLCLAIPGTAQTNGLQLQNAVCGTGDAQSFYLEGAAGDSGYRLKTTSGKCVGVAGASTAAGATLVLGDCLSDGAAHQRFALTEYSQGHWTLAPRHAPAMCLSVAASAGAGLALAACSVAAATQRFRLADIPTPGVPSAKGYRYVIRESVSGKCLTLPAATAGTSAATLAPCDGTAAQRLLAFRNPSSTDPNAHQLVPLSSFSALSATGRLCLLPSAPSNPLWLFPCNPDAAAQILTIAEVPPRLRFSVEWQRPVKAEPLSLVTHIGASSRTGYCSEAESTATGADVLTVPCSATSALQRWRLVPQDRDSGGLWFYIKLDGTEKCILADANSWVPSYLGICGWSGERFRVQKAATGWRFISELAGSCLSQSQPGSFVSERLAASPCNAASALQTFTLDILPTVDANGMATTMSADDTDLDLVLSWTDAGVVHTITNGLTQVHGGAFGGDSVPDTSRGSEEVVWTYDAPTPIPASYRACVVRRGIVALGYTLPTVVLRVYDSTGQVVRTTSKTQVLTTTPLGPNAECVEGSPGPRPPSPPPPPPPALRFRVDFAFGGVPSKADFDIFVSWAVAGKTYVITSNSTSAVRGGVYGGNNQNGAGTTFEMATWAQDNGTLPDAVTYFVCVKYNASTIVHGLYNVTLRVYRNSSTVVASAILKAVNTSVPDSSYTCTTATPGFLRTFAYTRPVPPPSGPPMMIKTQWYRGVGTVAPVNDDLDLAVAWNVGNVRYNISYQNKCARSGCMDFDNYNRNMSYETASWNTSAPDAGVYDICVNWSPASHNYTVVLTVTRSGVNVLTLSKLILGGATAADLSACTSSAVGWWLRNGVPATTSDLDIFIAWRNPASGIVYMISYSTGAASVDGAFYSGDNTARGASYEYAYWPAGVAAPATTYYVCIQWGSYTLPAGVFTIVLYAFKDGVQFGSRRTVIDTTQPLNTTCFPGSNIWVGYVLFGSSPPTVTASQSLSTTGATSVVSVTAATAVTVEVPAAKVASTPIDGAGDPVPEGPDTGPGGTVEPGPDQAQADAALDGSGQPQAGAAGDASQADSGPATGTPAAGGGLATPTLVAAVVGSVVGVLAMAAAALALVSWRRARAAAGRVAPESGGGGPGFPKPSASSLSVPSRSGPKSAARGAAMGGAAGAAGGAARPTRELTRKQRRAIIACVASTDDVANLEIILTGVGLDPHQSDLESAAAAGALASCRWLRHELSRRQAPIDWVRVFIAAAKAGSRVGCEWCLEQAPAEQRATGRLKAANAAAYHSHHRLLEWLVSAASADAPIPAPSLPRILVIAFGGCDLATLQHLFAAHDTSPAAWSDDDRVSALAYALQSRTPDWQAKAELLVSEGAVPGDEHITFAARGLGPAAAERLEWLRSKGVDLEAGSEAPLVPMCGEALEWMLGRGMRLFPTDAIALGRGAAHAGELGVLEALARHSQPMDALAIMGAAATGGRPHILRWAVALGGRPLRDVGAVHTANIFTGVCRTGSVEEIRWLASQGCGMDEGAWSAAAESGCEAAVELLAELGCPKPACSEPYRTALREREWQLMRLLHRLGLPMGPSAPALVDGACSEGAPPDVVDWLLTEACAA